MNPIKIPLHSVLKQWFSHKNRASQIVFFLWFSVSLSAQGISPLVQHSAFWSYLNPVALDADFIDDRDFTFTLAHRRNSFIKPFTAKSPTFNFIGGKYKYVKNDNYWLAHSYFAQSQYEAIRYTHFQGGASYIRKFNSKLEAGYGINIGQGRYKINGGYGQLRPWDQGDPILEAESLSSSFYLNVGLFAQYKLIDTKKQDLTVFSGFTLPYIWLSKNSFVFMATPTNFHINRPSSQSFAVNTLFFGIKHQENNTYRSLQFYLQRELTKQTILGGMANYQKQIAKNSEFLFDVGLGFNILHLLDKKTVSFFPIQLGLTYDDNSNWRFKVSFSFYLHKAAYDASDLFLLQSYYGK